MTIDVVAAVPEKVWSGSGLSRLVVGTLVQVGRRGVGSLAAGFDSRHQVVPDAGSLEVRREIQLFVEEALHAVDADFVPRDTRMELSGVASVVPAGIWASVISASRT